jgi:hypothetical protein
VIENTPQGYGGKVGFDMGASAKILAGAAVEIEDVKFQVCFNEIVRI